MAEELFVPNISGSPSADARKLTTWDRHLEIENVIWIKMETVTFIYWGDVRYSKIQHSTLKCNLVQYGIDY